MQNFVAVCEVSLSLLSRMLYLVQVTSQLFLVDVVVLRLLLACQFPSSDRARVHQSVRTCLFLRELFGLLLQFGRVYASLFPLVLCHKRLENVVDGKLLSAANPSEVLFLV